MKEDDWDWCVPMPRRKRRRVRFSLFFTLSKKIFLGFVFPSRRPTLEHGRRLIFKRLFLKHIYDFHTFAELVSPSHACEEWSSRECWRRSAEERTPSPSTHSPHKPSPSIHNSSAPSKPTASSGSKQIQCLLTSCEMVRWFFTGSNGLSLFRTKSPHKSQNESFFKKKFNNFGSKTKVQN